MMRASRWSTKVVSSLLVGTMLGGSIPSGPAWADLVRTEAIITRTPTPEWDRARLRAVLAREDVRVQLQAYGVSAEEAAARVEALTDREVALIGKELDGVPAGGNGNAIIGLLLLGPIVLAAGLIVLIGWVIVQIVKGVAKNTASRESGSSVAATPPAKPFEGIVSLEVVYNDDSVGRMGYASAERCQEDRQRYEHLLGVLWKSAQCVGGTH
jgi:hypothetical protein